MGNHYCIKCKISLDYCLSVNTSYGLNCQKHRYNIYVSCRECDKIYNCRHNFKFYIFDKIPFIY